MLKISFQKSGSYFTVTLAFYNVTCILLVQALNYETFIQKEYIYYE